MVQSPTVSRGAEGGKPFVSSDLLRLEKTFFRTLYLRTLTSRPNPFVFRLLLSVIKKTSVCIFIFLTFLGGATF